jgi:hypothetical protein
VPSKELVGCWTGWLLDRLAGGLRVLLAWQRFDPEKTSAGFWRSSAFLSFAIMKTPTYPVSVPGEDNGEKTQPMKDEPPTKAWMKGKKKKRSWRRLKESR